MTYLVGTDEAGYGPNLGPLVIAGTLWHVPVGVEGDDLYERIPGIRAAGRRQAAVEPSLVIGDSKSLYSPASGLAALERGVFAALNVAPAAVSLGPATQWRTLLERCDAACGESLDSIAWYQRFERSLPAAISAHEAATAQQLLATGLNDAGVSLLGVTAKLIFPEQFNEAVASCGSKGTALSHWTLQMVDQLIRPLDESAILVQCDKHGARNRYGAVLQHVFPADWIEVREESRLQSVYRWGPATRRVEIRFVAKAERFMPAALASMTAKYLREMAMLAFNEYWQQQVPGLKPTAGYPLDAQRFRQQIAEKQRQLGIPDRVLWRQR